MTIKKRIVVVGGGFAGIKAALELGTTKHFAVTLIAPRSHFEYHGAMYRSATGRSPLEVVVPLAEIFADYPDVQVELDSVAELRPLTKEVECESGASYRYDQLIMAVGYVVNYFNIPGMAEYSETLYGISEAIQLRHKLVGAFRASQPGNPIEITIIGGGPTGVEVASDIRNFALLVAGKHGIEDLVVKPRLVEAAPRVLGGLSEEASRVALERLRHLKVEVLTDTKVKAAKMDSVDTDKGVLHSDVTIWTAGNKANPLFSFYPDLFSLDARQRVLVNEYFQANLPDIFVIGDAASTAYSGMAQTALHNAIWLADNLKRAERGQRQQAYLPLKPEYVVPIGGEWALLQRESDIVTGSEGWAARREADRWALENFLVYELAHKHWSQADRIAQF